MKENSMSKLTVDEAKRIVEELRHAGYEADVREDYSGRCMYGATCVGIVCESEALVLVGAAAERRGVPQDHIPSTTDNMGLRVIVY